MSKKKLWSILRFLLDEKLKNWQIISTGKQLKCLNKESVKTETRNMQLHTAFSTFNPVFFQSWQYKLPVSTLKKERTPGKGCKISSSEKLSYNSFYLYVVSFKNNPKCHNLKL